MVFIPKCRKKVIDGALRKHLGEIFRELAQQRECNVVEGPLMQNHVHRCLSIPPKYSVSNIVGFIKGKLRYRLLGNLEGVSETLQERCFGLAATSYRQSDWMRKWSARTSDAKRKMMTVTIK